MDVHPKNDKGSRDFDRPGDGHTAGEGIDEKEIPAMFSGSNLRLFSMREGLSKRVQAAPTGLVSENPDADLRCGSEASSHHPTPFSLVSPLPAHS